jgi:hypothetical protein
MSAADTTPRWHSFSIWKNIALGAQEAQFPAFDIRKVLERLLLKGHMVVRRRIAISSATRLSSADCMRRPSS